MTKKARILVVDDTPVNLHLLGRILKGEGYDVRLVPSGKLALISAGKEPPDLVLLDIRMPEMSGYEVCEQLKADDRTRNIPVIFISALRETSDKVKAFSLGGVDYISKPIQKEEVLARVRTHLDLQTLQNRLRERNSELTETNEQLHREIEERKQAEAALRESEERFRTLVEHGADAIFMHDFMGGILMINQQASESLGYPKEELLAMNILDFQDYGSDRIKKGRYWEDVSSDRPLLFETRFKPKRGNPFQVEIRMVRVQLGGQNVIVSFARDVQLRKQMEEERLRMNKLESLAVFTGGIAHDFNNLLYIITGNIDLFKEDLELDSDSLRRLDRVETAARRAADLIRELLTFSKGGEPVKKTASVHKLIADTIEIFKKPPDVEFNLNFPPDLPQIEFDEIQMRQVLNNMINNSVEAMPDGGIIDIRAAGVILDDPGVVSGIHLEPGGYVTIRIRDRGIGIPKENISYIFDPYFTTKPKGNRKGTGLGLSSAYSIIKKHNGRISVESETATGTVFTICLPVAAEMPGYIPETLVQQIKPPRTGGRILAMDDEEMIREMLDEMLTLLGYKAQTTRDGDETVALYKRAMQSGEPFTAVILDLTIKDGMDGKETLEKLSEFDPEVKAVISSGYCDDPVMASFKEHGFLDAIPKPYKLKKLGEVLKRVVG